jgi:hypothetical protein
MVRPEDGVPNLFAKIRSDLLAGNFVALASHIAALEELATRLDEQALDRDALPVLRHEAERSRDMVGAAARGVRAALRRIGEAGAPTAVYSRDGMRIALGGPGGVRGSRA